VKEALCSKHQGIFVRRGRRTRQQGTDYRLG
jgi:hypothetical protein